MAEQRVPETPSTDTETIVACDKCGNWVEKVEVYPMAACVAPTGEVFKGVTKLCTHCAEVFKTTHTASIQIPGLHFGV